MPDGKPFKSGWGLAGAAIPITLAQSPLVLGQTAPFTYTVLGSTARTKPGPMENIPDPATYTATNEIALRFDPPTGMHLSIGGLGESQLRLTGANGIGFLGEILLLGFASFDGGGSLHVISGPGGQQLRHVAYLFFSRLARSGTEYNFDDYEIVYGIATPPASVPRAGIVRYGESLEQTVIEIDYATGRVTGHVRTNTGVVATLADGALSLDRTVVTGRFVAVDGSRYSTIEARLAGPDASELMARRTYHEGVITVGGFVRIG